MKRAISVSALILLFAASLAIAGNVRPAAEPVPGQYIVVLNNWVRDVPAAAAEIAAQQGGLVDRVWNSALRGFSVRMSAAGAEALSHNPNVAWVEEEGLAHAITTQTSATWGLDRIDQRYLPVDTTYTYNQTGSSVHAYIIDTGILFTHVEFGGRAVSGFDAVDGGTADDCNGHGTHVAGTVGGSTYGVAKNVHLVAVRVLDCNGSGLISGIVSGIDWLTANAERPAVANMSLGGGISDAMDLAVKNSIASGITYSVAAGNGNRAGRPQDACNYSPARVPEAITVSATTITDQKASFANYGPSVALFAPGVSITSAWLTSTTATATISGTSRSAPHVAGAAALYLELNPGAAPQAVRDAIYDATTKDSVVDPLTTNNHLLYTLAFDGSEPSPVNVPPVASFSATVSELTVSVADTSTDSDGSILSRSWSFGDGATATEATITHTYAAAGTYTVTLAITDDDGATATASRSVAVAETPASIVLEATARIVRNKAYADLVWSGATGTDVDVYRDGVLRTTTPNDGAYTDNLSKLRGTFTYKVCESGTSTCSNEASVTF